MSGWFGIGARPIPRHLTRMWLLGSESSSPNVGIVARGVRTEGAAKGAARVCVCRVGVFS